MCSRAQLNAPFTSCNSMLFKNGQFSLNANAQCFAYLCFMILYNVTVNIDPEVHEDWLNWMKNTHIPDVLNTGLFIDNKFLRVLNTEEGEGFTYSIQYFLETIEHYDDYKSRFAPALQAEYNKRYQNRFVAFRTLLETV